MGEMAPHPAGAAPQTSLRGALAVRVASPSRPPGGRLRPSSRSRALPTPPYRRPRSCRLHPPPSATPTPAPRRPPRAARASATAPPAPPAPPALWRPPRPARAPGDPLRPPHRAAPPTFAGELRAPHVPPATRSAPAPPRGSARPTARLRRPSPPTFAADLRRRQRRAVPPSPTSPGPGEPDTVGAPAAGRLRSARGLSGAALALSSCRRAPTPP